jgi:hypothetical protein
MGPALRGHLTLPLSPGVRFDPGRFVSLLAVRLEQSGARVQRHGPTLAFEDLRLWGARRPLAWCKGTAEVQAHAAGPRSRYSLRFTEAARLGAAVVGGFVGISLWQLGRWTVPGCLLGGVATFFAYQGLEALCLLAWFRRVARRCARDVTYRSPRTAA